MTHVETKDLANLNMENLKKGGEFSNNW